MMFSALLLLSAAFLQTSVAHQADESFEVLNMMKRHTDKATRSLESCQHKLLKNRELHARRFERREVWVDAHLQKRGLRRRSGSETSLSQREVGRDERQVDCILAPEVTLGPYWLDRMPIREDNREEEPGVDLLLELQFINVNTCKPVKGAYIDMWHANSTGAYGGFKVEGTEGKTWLRGLQPTNSDGVVQFTTIWPGHYPGRAVHTHIMAHWGGAVSGRHYIGGSRPHVGQVFYDQNVITAVEALPPYNTNPHVVVLNPKDSTFRAQNTGYNAIAKTWLLGSKPAHGYLASISVGIDI